MESIQKPQLDTKEGQGKERKAMNRPGNIRRLRNIVYATTLAIASVGGVTTYLDYKGNQREASAKYEGEGNFWYAAVSAEKAGDAERAKELWRKDSAKCEREGDFWYAAVSAEKAGDAERAKELWRKASAKFEKLNFWAAAFAAEKAGDAERAKELYARDMSSQGTK